MSVHILDHPLLQHKLTILRDENTGTKDFRATVSEIAMLMCYEATRNLPLEDIEVKTPIGPAQCKTLAGKKLAVVPILRAGLGMVDGILTLIPSAKVGHIGLYRNEETLEPVKYYCKMPPDIAEREIIIVDPMLATGGSATAAIQFMKDYGCTNIKMMNILAAPRASSASRRIILISSSMWLRWMKSSMSMAISSPVWAMPATASSEPNEHKNRTAVRRSCFAKNKKSERILRSDFLAEKEGFEPYRLSPITLAPQRVLFCCVQFRVQFCKIIINSSVSGEGCAVEDIGVGLLVCGLV